jgi:prophage antirepressor-like protein
MQHPLSPTNPALVGDDCCDIIGYRNNERQLPIASKAASSLTIS